MLGGLGNQLFCLAAALALANKVGSKVVINTSQLKSRPLAIPENILRETECSDKSSLYYKINSNLFRRVYRNTGITRSYFEKEYGFESRFNDIKKPLRLHGYFQSIDYFKGSCSEILRLLESEKNLTTQYENARGILPNRFTSIHFRRGDYLYNSDFHPLTTQEYYSRAIGYLERQKINSKKVVFTDDERLAREFFPTDIVITSSLLENTFDTLYLMSRGEAIIGSNSTFSLWAGLLLNERGGVSIFPKTWFGKGNLANESPVPPNFIRL